MATSELYVNADKVMGQTVVQVQLQGPRLFKARLSLAAAAFALGSWILGSKCSVKIDLVEATK